MTKQRLVWLVCAALAAPVLGAAPALADAIDGNWCFEDGRTMSIDGPKIITPGGTAMTGNYDRHGFAYTVPANEEGAGTDVIMVLLNEETVQLNNGTTTEIWHRCSPTV